MLRLSQQRLFSVLCVALLLSGVLLMPACSGSSSTNAGAPRAAAPPPVPVGVAVAEKRDMPVYLSGLGNVTALYTVTLKTRVDGQIMQVNFKEGQEVKKDQLLIQIDPRPYQVALESAQATLFKDQTQYRIAAREFQRYQDLFQEGVVSREQLDAQESTAGALEGTVKADQAAVDNAQLNLVYCKVTSPINGRIGIRLVDPGNMVHASDAGGMLVITQLKPITVIFTLPEDSLSTITSRMGRGTLPVEIYSRDDRTRLATGQLLTIDNQIDTTTGTVRLKAIAANESDQLWPNQFVNVRLLLDTRKDATVIPSAALQRGAQGTYAFVVQPDKSVKIQPITVGLTQGNLIVIDSGINPGDQVVVDGQDKLQDGSKVVPTVTGQKAAAPQAPAAGAPAAPGKSNPAPKPGGQGTQGAGGRKPGTVAQ